MKKKLTLRESDYLDKVPNSNIGLYKKYGTPIVSKYSRYPFKIGDPVYLKQHNSVGFIIDGPTEEDPDFPEKGIGWGGEARTDVDGVQSLKYMVPFNAAKHSKVGIPPSVKKVLFKESKRSRVRGVIKQIIKEEVKRALAKRLREGVGKYYISYYATVGEHGEAGTYNDFNTAVSAAISKKKQKNGEGESFMDGLEYLGVEGAQGADEFAIIFITKEYVNKIRPNWFKDNNHYKTYLAAAKDSLRTGKVVKGTYSYAGR